MNINVTIIIILTQGDFNYQTFVHMMVDTLAPYTYTRGILSELDP